MTTAHVSRLTAHATGAQAPVVTVDGPSGAGKGTLSRASAAEFGWRYLDSGALYRLVGLLAARQQLSADKAEDVEKAAAAAREMQVRFEVDDQGRERILFQGEDVGSEIRTEAAGERASHFAARPQIRAALLDFQRAYRRQPGLIADGRDMGTVVFPDAPLKLFVTASAEERARRRVEQLKELGQDAKFDRIYREVKARDARDQAREHSPLRPADDAVVLDTTELSIDEALAAALDLVKERGLSA